MPDSAEGQAELLGQQRIGIGADGIEGHIAEIEETGEPDDDVQAPGQHDVDQDLDAEVVDVFQRPLRSRQHDRQRRVDQKTDEGDLQEIPLKEVLPVGDLRDAGLGLVPLALVQMRLDEADDQEATDGRDHDEDRKQAPARAPDKGVVDVLVGLDADVKDEEAEGDGGRDQGLLGSLSHQAVVVRRLRHVRLSPLPDGQGCRSV